MKNILYIDTSDNRKIEISLETGSKKVSLFSESLVLKSEAALPLIDKILKKEKIEVEDLTEIRVNEGPGSFTGLRVGMSIGNALGFLLKIPVNGKKIGELAKPVYNE